MEKRSGIHWPSVIGISAGLIGLGVGAAISTKAYKKRKEESVVIQAIGDKNSRFTVEIHSCDPAEPPVTKTFSASFDRTKEHRVYVGFDPAKIIFTVDADGIGGGVSLRSLTRKGVNLVADADVSFVYNDYYGMKNVPQENFKWETSVHVGENNTLTVDRTHLVCSTDEELP